MSEWTPRDLLGTLEVYEWTPTGSSYICNPPVTDTDIDFALRVGDLKEAVAALTEADWAVSNEDPEYRICSNGEFEFITARKGVFNLIIFVDWVAFWAFSEATRVAKHLNLTKKEDRVMLFQAVCGNRNVENF